jgi:DNA-directed RNA polymerase specialized sigma24 family protein
MTSKDSNHDTSLNVRRALDGDSLSLEWVVKRFTPFLLLQAEIRMSSALRKRWDPEDLVSDVWVTTLPRLRDIEPREGHYARVLIRYLSTVLLHRVLDLLKRQRRRGDALPLNSGEDSPSLSAQESGVVSKATRKERSSLLYRAMTQLDSEDQRLLVYRGIEQRRIWRKLSTKASATPEAKERPLPYSSIGLLTASSAASAFIRCI